MTDMSERPFDRKSISAFFAESNPALSERVAFAGNDRLREAPVILSASNADGQPDETTDALIAALYVSASLHHEEDLSEVMNLGYVGLWSGDPQLDEPARAIFNTAIGALESRPHYDPIDRDIIKQALIGHVHEQHLGSHAFFLAGVELWMAPQLDDDDSNNSYTTLITPRYLRKFPRIMSERALRLRREGREDEIPDDYKDFAFTQTNVVRVGHMLSANVLSMLHREDALPALKAGATIDTEPRDTH